MVLQKLRNYFRDDPSHHFEKTLNEFEGEDEFEKFENLIDEAGNWLIDEREGSNIDEMVLDFGDNGGLFFFHTQNPKYLQASQTNLVRAFVNATRPVQLQKDIVTANYEDFTEENVVNELRSQLEEFIGMGFKSELAANFGEMLDFPDREPKPGEKPQPDSQTTL